MRAAARVCRGRVGGFVPACGEWAIALCSVPTTVRSGHCVGGSRAGIEDSGGYAVLAVFGSVGRGQARPDSDIDLLVQAPAGTSSFDLVRFQLLLAQVVGRGVDLVEYGGWKDGLDDDIRREAVLL